jgi:plastocyanin
MIISKGLVAALSIGLAGALGASTAGAADPNGRNVVTVAFGAGLNTAQPGNSANHHILPKQIDVEAGDVVSFVVGGLHIIRAYSPGVRLRDITDQIPDECEVNPVPSAADAPQCYFGNVASPVAVIPSFGLSVYYEGINPLAAPPPAPPFAQASAAVNRVESVSFLKPGRYLVICAVLPHFNDRMIAWVEVHPKGTLNN